MEEWKDIKEYEGCYQISNLGRVKSLSRTVIYKDNDKHFYEGKLIKQQLNDETGYLIVKLSRNHKQKTITVHRLVAEAFIENINKKPLVNHKNGIKTDNRASNLEWCTQSENMQHAGKYLFNSKIKSNNRKVKCSNGEIFNSSYEAARFINEKLFDNKNKIHIIANSIRNICNKKVKKRKENGKERSYIPKIAYGYSWEHVN